MNPTILRAAGAACVLGMLAAGPISAQEANRAWVNPPLKAEPGEKPPEQPETAKAEPAAKLSTEQAKAVPETKPDAKPATEQAKVEPKAKPVESAKSEETASAPTRKVAETEKAKPTKARRTARAAKADKVRAAESRAAKRRVAKAERRAVRTASRPAAAQVAERSSGPLQLMRLTTYQLPDGRLVQVLTSPTERDVDLLASR